MSLSPVVRAAVVGLAAAAIAVPLEAQTVTISTVSSSFSNVVGGTNVSTAQVGNTSQARWGVGANQSGYNFTPDAPPAFDVDLSGGPATFRLGLFSHLNFPINAGTSITGLRLNLSFSIVGSSVDPFNQFFNLTHNETPNADNPCADGGANGVDPNQNGCADNVSFSLPGVGSGFFIGADQYFVRLIGFGETANTLQNSYWTTEGEQNDTFLWAELTTVDPGVVVPEPSTYALMAFGLAGLGAVARRRRQQV